MNCGATRKPDRCRGKYKTVEMEDTFNVDTVETDQAPLLSSMDTSPSLEGEKTSKKLVSTDICTAGDVTGFEKTDKVEDLTEELKECTGNTSEEKEGKLKEQIDEVVSGIGSLETVEDVKRCESKTTEDVSETAKQVCDIGARKSVGASEDENVPGNLDNVIKSINRSGARAKRVVRKVNSEQVLNTSVRPPEERMDLDIVRKMSEPNSRGYIPWQLLGTYYQLKQKSCQRLYAASGRSDDLALFFHNGRFYAMEAWCSHMGRLFLQFTPPDFIQLTCPSFRLGH